MTEAVAAYLRALALRPDDPQANLNLATAYYQLGERPRRRLLDLAKSLHAEEPPAVA